MSGDSGSLMVPDFDNNAPISDKDGERDFAEYGPWSPGIQSQVPSRLIPLSTIFQVKNVFTSISRAAELARFTGLEPEEFVVFRPERLVVHELLIRVTADLSVPDPEGASINDFGINFRQIAQRILTSYIVPQLPEIAVLYDSLRKALAVAVNQELTAILPPRQAAARPPARNGGGRLLAFFRDFGKKASAHREPASDAEEQKARSRESQTKTNIDPVRQAARLAVAKVISAVRRQHGSLWGDRHLLGMLAIDLACNEHCSRAIGDFIEPRIREACVREGYNLLSPQERPIVMNVKGASASGKSTMRPLLRELAKELQLRWGHFAVISPDVWRKFLLDYDSLGNDYKYAGALTGRELAIIDQKLDSYIASKAVSRGIPHLLIDRFRFDSFAPLSDEIGSNLLTRFGETIYLFFMITPPHETVPRAWKRGLEVGRFKAIDDLLAHNVEAYSGMPELFFTWALHPLKNVHYEFLDNDVPLGERPRTVAFGRRAEMNILDVKGMLDIERYRKIDVSATTPEQVYRDRKAMAPIENTHFLARCVRTLPIVNFVDRSTGRIYLRFQSGALAWIEPQMLEAALQDEQTEAALRRIAPGARGAKPVDDCSRILAANRFHTLGRWGKGRS